MLRAASMAASKIVLVTGGNSGLGYETVKALLRSDKPHQVLLGSRSLEKAEKAIESIRRELPDAKNIVEPLEVDLNSDASCEKAAAQVESKHGRLDTLINNAAATFDLEFLAGKVSLRESFTKSYDGNVAGTHVLTWALAPLLLKSSDPRLIFVSGLARITKADEEYFPTPPLPAGWPKKVQFEVIGYRCTKVALNMLMLDWSHKLKADGVKVWGVEPGMMATNLGGVPELAIKMGAAPPSISGELLRGVVEGERDADAGHLIYKDGRSPY